MKINIIPKQVEFIPFTLVLEVENERELENLIFELREADSNTASQQLCRALLRTRPLKKCEL